MNENTIIAYYTPSDSNSDAKDLEREAFIQAIRNNPDAWVVASCAYDEGDCWCELVLVTSEKEARKVLLRAVNNIPGAEAMELPPAGEQVEVVDRGLTHTVTAGGVECGGREWGNHTKIYSATEENMDGL
jgi:hypothetical protein